MEKEFLKKALFDVEITSAGVDVKLKAVSYDVALGTVKALVDSLPDDKKLREAFRDGSGFGFMGMSSGDFRYHVSAYLPETELPEEFFCPRRAENPMADKRFPGPDKWKVRGDDPCCSYCGSMKPSRVLDLIRENGFKIIGETDKWYKRYIIRPEVPNASFGGIKFYVPHFSEDEIKEYNRLLDESRKTSPPSETATVAPVPQ